MNKLDSLELIAPDLARVDGKMLGPDPDRHEAVQSAITNLINSGGKRIRPTVALLACRMLEADREKSITLAAAVEMLHTATLVHDDIIDGALMRRGNPTLNAAWSPGATILTGDYLFARAAYLASQTDNVLVMRLFAQALMTVCNGELDQMFNTRKYVFDRHSYFRRIYAKTGALFVLATEASAILASTSEESRADLSTYGKELGIAFQIVDDMLDFVGSESQVGKPLGGDLAQGLVTLPTICFLEQFPGDERILNVLDGQRKPESIQLALEAVRNADAIAGVMEEAALHSRRAKTALDRLPDNRYRQTLIELADYTVWRQL